MTDRPNNSNERFYKEHKDHWPASEFEILDSERGCMTIVRDSESAVDELLGILNTPIASSDGLEKVCCGKGTYYGCCGDPVPATSSDNSKLIEALECAKYAIENPDSNQDFAVWAIDHALNSATSSERVSISRECAEYAAECMSAETRRVEGICERLLDGKVPDKIHQRFKLIKELRAALEKDNE